MLEDCLVDGLFVDVDGLVTVELDLPALRVIVVVLASDVVLGDEIDFVVDEVLAADLDLVTGDVVEFVVDLDPVVVVFVSVDEAELLPVVERVEFEYADIVALVTAWPANLALSSVRTKLRGTNVMFT